jgi:hypothetical protein
MSNEVANSAKDEEYSMGSAGSFARSSSWLALLISIASVAGIALALLGYGVAIAVQSKFGLPHSMTFSSSLELFNRGCWAVAQVLMSAYEGAAWLKAVQEIWSASWPITLAIVGLLLIVGILLWGASISFKKLNRLMSAPVARLTGGKSVLDFLRDHRSAGKITAFVTVAVGIIVGTPFVMALGLIGLVFLCAVLALIPQVGLAVGKVHIDDWVIRPTVCMGLKTRDARMDKTVTRPKIGAPVIYGANCIAIVRGKEEVDRGRVVFATPNAVILYDPRTGDVRRVSVDGATVKVIGEL